MGLTCRRRGTSAARSGQIGRRGSPASPRGRVNRRGLGVAMSRLVDFYRGAGTDTGGRQLAEIWAWGDDDLEAVHDFIQWLFPLPEPSRFNPDAPRLTEADIATFRGDPLLQG